MPVRILTVVHNHSSLHPGGTELFAEALHASYANRSDVDARLIAALDPALRPELPGTAIQSMPDCDGVYFFRAPGFDPVSQSRTSLEPLLYDFQWFMDEFRPDIVHLHHLNHFGLEAIAFIKSRYKRTKIVLTLHDYYLMCANDGLMFTKAGARCASPQPSDCARCFPAVPAAQFRARQLNVQRHLELVDQLIAPSVFLKRKFVEWGVPESRIQVVRNGWPIVPSGSIGSERPQNGRFALIGNLRETKGTLVVLKAFNDALSRHPETGLSLDVFGAPLYQPQEFVDAVTAEVTRAEGRIQLHGSYRSADAGNLLARCAWVLVPSLWWENAPLVVNEAFDAGRPVLCSDIGGMAEAVTDGVDGLHVPAGDVVAWSEAIVRAAEDPALWSKLSRGIGLPRTLDQAANDYIELFGLKRAG